MQASLGVWLREACHLHCFWDTRKATTPQRSALLETPQRHLLATLGGAQLTRLVGYCPNVKPASIRLSHCVTWAFTR